MESQFNINRLKNFLIRQAVLNSSSLFVRAGGVFGVLFLVSVLFAYNAPVKISQLTFAYSYALYFCGLIFTSRIFAELHHPNKSYAYLTLPVSTAEKFAGSWLLACPGYALLFYVICICIYFTACITAGNLQAFPEIFAMHIWKTVAHYLVIQSIFFLGAVYFTNNNFMKTVFALFLFFVAVGMVGGILTAVLFGHREGAYGMNISLDHLSVEALLYFRIFFYGLLGPFMLLVSYIRLKERQV